MLDFLWLVALLPFLGVAVNAALGPRVDKKWTTAVALGAPGLSLLVALGCIFEYVRGVSPAPFQIALYTWSAAGIEIDVGFLLDPLSAVMVFVVTFVGFLIHVYSVGYMAHEKGYQRYFVYLNLFMGSMLLLVLGSNFLVTFVGWEGVGLCSYLLIGFYYDQEFPPYAGRKAFIVNRIGDFAFLIGLFALVARFGTLDYGRVSMAVHGAPEAAQEPYLLGLSFAGFVGLCLFIGAMGKSAQIPLYVWLPDAMAGPTPVSALIHAATMVTAGVYMLARTNFLYQLAEAVSAFVAVIGALTAIFAATIGLAQTDIKKVLAYSTVSQLGYMFLAAGVGAYSAAIFHLGTHAFFKALLFLGSGSVIHAMSGEQDLTKMGGLRAKLPATYRTMLIGTLAIAGVPLLSGFFSKDEILAAAWGSSKPLWVVGWIDRRADGVLHDAAAAADVPRRVPGHRGAAGAPARVAAGDDLAADGAGGGSGGGGLRRGAARWGTSTSTCSTASWRRSFRRDRPRTTRRTTPSLAVELLLMAASVAIAAAGIWLAWRIYGGTPRDSPGGRGWAERYRPSTASWSTSTGSTRSTTPRVVRPLAALSRFFFRSRRRRADRGRGPRRPDLSRIAGELARLTTTGNVRNYALYFLGGVLLLLWWLLA